MRAFLIAGVFLAIMATVIAIARVAAAQGTATSAPNGRLMTIHDRGTEKVFLSKANTVGGALKEAGIPFDATDAVEPAASEPLVATDYQVNIYRSRPVVVVDGVSSRVVMTPYQTPAKIAKHAGITLYDEDTTTINPTDDIVNEGAGLRMTIDRATQFSFTLYGKKIDARTQATTVGAMLKEKNITLASNDVLSVDQKTPITAGMAVELWRNGVQTVTQDEEIKFETEQIKDADQPVGYKKVQTPGVVGKKTVTYEIEMKNGQELNRKEIQSVTTSQPQKQVEVIGTKYSLPAGSHEDWMAAAGIAASDYGFVNYIVNHEGGWCPVRWQGDPGCNDHGGVPSIGGYGLVQATPGSKMASAGSDWLTNPITQLKWATGYAVGRYGSWEGAYNHWLSSHNW